MFSSQKVRAIPRGQVSFYSGSACADLIFSLYGRAQRACVVTALLVVNGTGRQTSPERAIPCAKKSAPVLIWADGHPKMYCNSGCAITGSAG